MLFLLVLERDNLRLQVFDRLLVVVSLLLQSLDLLLLHQHRPLRNVLLCRRLLQLLDQRRGLRLAFFQRKGKRVDFPVFLAQLVS